MSASSRPTGLRLSHGESMIQLPSLLLNASVLPCGTGNLTISAYLCWHLAARSMTSQHSAQGRSQDFSKGGSPSGDRRLYMVYTAALPRVSAGSVVLSRHEGPY